MVCGLEGCEAWYLGLEACVLVALMAGFEGDDGPASVAKDVGSVCFEGGTASGQDSNQTGAGYHGTPSVYPHLNASHFQSRPGSHPVVYCLREG